MKADCLRGPLHERNPLLLDTQASFVSLRFPIENVIKSHATQYYPGKATEAIFDEVFE